MSPIEIVDANNSNGDNSRHQITPPNQTCKWKAISEDTYEKAFIKDRVFCPCCGRKIEVVE